MSDNLETEQVKSPGLNGWIEAGLFVVAISVLTIVYTFTAGIGANVIVFVLFSTAFAALGMLLITGPGRDPLRVIRTRQSWLFGVASVAMELAFYQLLATVSPAEASLLVRLTVPVSLLLGWLLFARHISRMTLVGTAVVICAVVPVFWFLQAGVWMAALVLALACAVIAAVKTFASEFHPQNRAAETVMDKLRVTGLVVLATTIVGMGLMVPLSLLAAGGAIADFGFIPPLSAYFHWPTVLCAVGLGAPLLIAMNYLTFSSTVKITTENFLATSAFTPLGALIAQTVAFELGLIGAVAFDPWLLVAIAIGIIGVMIIIAGRRGVV